MNNFERIDLHLHTTASDGSDTPSQLVEKAREAGITVMAITDHDTIEGLRTVEAPDGIRVINGIEFSCHSEEGDFDCHILGYGFDPDNESLLRAITHGREMRLFKLDRRIEYLDRTFGIRLYDSEIAELRSYNSVAKPHLARILIRRGLATSVADAIDRYLKGAKFPDDRIDAKEAIDAIHDAGGISVYAHPLGGERERRLTPCEVLKRILALKSLGIDGLEAVYSRYNKEERELLMGIARELSLTVSAGSDYHGENKTVRLGELSSDGDVCDVGKIGILERLKI